MPPLFGESRVVTHKLLSARMAIPFTKPKWLPVPLKSMICTLLVAVETFTSLSKNQMVANSIKLSHLHPYLYYSVRAISLIVQLVDNIAPMIAMWIKHILVNLLPFMVSLMGSPRMEEANSVKNINLIPLVRGKT